MLSAPCLVVQRLIVKLLLVLILILVVLLGYPRDVFLYNQEGLFRYPRSVCFWEVTGGVFDTLPLSSGVKTSTHCALPLFQPWRKATSGPCTRTDTAAQPRSAGARLQATRTGPTRVSGCGPAGLPQRPVTIPLSSWESTLRIAFTLNLFVQTFCSLLKVETLKPVFSSRL